jgi:outer membrane protein, heavy metal efflux system
MRHGFRAVIVGLGALMLARTTTAQPAPADLRPPRYVDVSGGLSLADAIRQAIEREPSLRAARSQIEVARARRTQAGLLPNPSLSVEYRGEPAGTDNQTMAELQWPLDLYRRGPREAVADREIEAVLRTVEDRERLLIAEVRMRYGQAAAIVREAALADATADAVRRQLNVLRQRVDEGAVPPIERDVMEVELLRFEADVLLATARADTAVIELKRTIGLPANLPLLLRDTLDMLAPPLLSGEETSIGPLGVAPKDSAAIQARADVREAAAHASVAEARIERARSEGRLDLSLFGSYMRMDAGFPQRGVGEDLSLERVRGVFHYASAGVMVTLPFMNRNQGEVAVAQAEHVGAMARVEATQLAAEAEVAAAVTQESYARLALTSVERSVRLARQNLEVVRQTYELGRGTIAQVLTEQRRYLDAELAYTRTLAAAYEARAALQRARGEGAP